jgi:hypothetical protein
MKQPVHTLDSLRTISTLHPHSVDERIEIIPKSTRERHIPPNMWWYRLCYKSRNEWDEGEKGVGCRGHDLAEGVSLTMLLIWRVAQKRTLVSAGGVGRTHGEKCVTIRDRPLRGRGYGGGRWRCSPPRSAPKSMQGQIEMEDK